jgi:hypothetical protein
LQTVATRLEWHLRPSERSCERDERARFVVHAAMVEHALDALGLDTLWIRARNPPDDLSVRLRSFARTETSAINRSLERDVDGWH